MSDLKERIRGLKRCDVCKRAVRNAQLKNELIDKDRLREEAFLASLANKFVGNEVIDRPDNPR